MSDEKRILRKYPLLEDLLESQGARLQGTYTNRDVAKLFKVSVRTIQDWARNGELKSRNLPGRSKFLSQDLEEFLSNSCKRTTRQGGRP